MMSHRLRVIIGLLVVLSSLRLVLFRQPLLFGLVPVAPALLTMVLGWVLVTRFRSGHRASAAVGLAVLVVAVGLALPGEVLPRFSCPPPGDGTAVHLYSHNVNDSTGDPQAAAAQIHEVGPDIVVLQEADTWFLDQLDEELGDRYPNLVAAGSSGSRSLTVLSAWPLTLVDDTSDQIRKRNPLLVVDAATPIGDLRVVNLHLTSPGWSGGVNRRRAEYPQLRANEYGADVIMGDFNSTHAHQDFTRLLDVGFQDGHRRAGCGLGTTWSPFGAGPGILALDHAVVADSLSVSAHRINGYGGSDHRAISVWISEGGP